MKQKLVVCLVLIVAACSTPSSLTPLNIPLQYKTMASPTDFPTLPACAALSKTEVQDARDEKTLGKRFVEGQNTAPAAVSTSSDIASWVASALEGALNRTAIPTGRASAPTLLVTVNQITTSENVVHRAGYEARVALSAELRSARGESCWKGRADGSSQNYGYAGSTENYQETLNHALDRAMINVLSAPEFRKSICSCGETSR